MNFADFHKIVCAIKMGARQEVEQQEIYFLTKCEENVITADQYSMISVSCCSVMGVCFQ